MQINDIKKGANIELEVRYAGQTISFHNDIVDIIDNSVFINPIKVNDQTLGFTDQYQVNFIFLFDGKVYVWEDVSVKLVKLNGKVCHMINISGEGKPYNRRNAFRLYLGEDMPVYVNTAKGPTAVTVLIKDISETGVAFISKEDYDTDRTIRLKLKDNNLLISLSGVIIRKVFLENLNSYLYGCKFTEKNNRLGNYIAKKQSEMLRKKSNPVVSPYDIKHKFNYNQIKNE